MNQADIEKDLRKRLSAKRMRHTVGVQYTSCCLAMRWEEDICKASLAGLLHDCAKQLSGEQRLEECRKHTLPVNESQQNSPYLLHGQVGAYFAQHRYGVEDPDILRAIEYHTTGRPGMSLLEKIVFTADYIEPQRDQAPDLPMLRKTAFTDLDKAVLMILRQTLDYLQQTGARIDPMTEETWHYYSLKRHGE